MPEPLDPFLADVPTLAQIVVEHDNDVPSVNTNLPRPNPPGLGQSINFLFPWMASLQVHDRGTLLGSHKSNHNNAIIALTLAPEWQGVFGYNEFDSRVWVRRKNGLMFIEPDEQVSDLHFATLHQWFDKLNIEMTTEKLRLAVHTVASMPQNKYHPVRAYLTSLPVWDGVPVLSTWLEYMFGAQGDPEYLSAIGQCWMRCAVARVMDPGCKADNMLIIEGDQGIGKSMALRALAGEWFTDQISSDLASVAASHSLQGKWIIELSELAGVRKSEIEDIKAFVSRQADYYRKPYARQVEEVPRQCVLAGTTNITDWLKDESGGRRFWPFFATKIKIDLIRQQRNQLWAEALWQYQEGLPLHLDYNIGTKAKLEQSKRLEDDEWVELVETYMLGKDTATTQQITTEMLGIPVGSVTTVQSRRLSGVMTRLGYVRVQVFRGGVNHRGYRRRVLVKT